MGAGRGRVPATCAGHSGARELLLCTWVSLTHSIGDTVASNAQEFNITVPAVIQLLMLSSHGIICQGPSPAFTGWFAGAESLQRLRSPVECCCWDSNLFRFKTFTTVLKAGRSFACGRVLGY